MFAVETYRVSSYLERFPGETRPTRVLELTGPVLFHGLQNRAVLSFSSFFDGVRSSPVAGFLTDGGLAGLSPGCPWWGGFPSPGSRIPAASCGPSAR